MDILILDTDVYYSSIITLQLYYNNINEIGCLFALKLTFKSDYKSMNFEEHIYNYLASLRCLALPSVSSLKPVATLLVAYIYYVL